MNFTFFPECSGASDHMKHVADVNFQDISEYCHGYEEESITQEYFQTVGEELGLSQPRNWREALAMYTNLCETAQS